MNRGPDVLTLKRLRALPVGARVVDGLAEVWTRRSHPKTGAPDWFSDSRGLVASYSTLWQQHRPLMLTPPASR